MLATFIFIINANVIVITFKFITIGVSIALFFLYGGITDISKDILLNSSILAPVAWDWVIKPLCKWIKIDYKDDDDK